MKLKRGDIVFIRLSSGIGSEQGGTRPAVVIQNDVGNKFSPTTIVALFTTKNKAKLPTHVEVSATRGLMEDSTLMLEQLRTIDKSRIFDKLGSLDADVVKQINKALTISLGLGGGDISENNKEFNDYLSYHVNTPVIYRGYRRKRLLCDRRRVVISSLSNLRLPSS